MGGGERERERMGNGNVTWEGYEMFKSICRQTMLLVKKKNNETESHKLKKTNEKNSQKKKRVSTEPAVCDDDGDSYKDCLKHPKKDIETVFITCETLSHVPASCEPVFVCQGMSQWFIPVTLLKGTILEKKLGNRKLAYIDSDDISSVDADWIRTWMAGLCDIEDNVNVCCCYQRGSSTSCITDTFHQCPSRFLNIVLRE